MEEVSFPRGRIKQDAEDPNKKKKKRRHKSPDDALLFGRSTRQPEAKRIHKEKKTTSSSSVSVSMLPLGGGGCVLPPSKSSSSTSSSNNKASTPYIEALSFSKLTAGFKMLAICREIHDDFCIFSLPNLWTGFMMMNDAERFHLSVGTVYAVMIVKAVSETTKEGPRRRIQVTVDPSKLNPRCDIQKVPGIKVTGCIRSVEDHGVLVDLGLQRRGFLAFSDIQGEYSLEENNNDDSTQRFLSEGRLLDFVVSSKTSTSSIIPLTLPEDIAKVTMPPGYKPSLSDLQPGTLVNVVVDKTFRNGLAVSFGLFRGAIEFMHLGCIWIPDHKQEDTTWKRFFEQHLSLTARILAVEPTSKIVRLTLLPHLLALHAPKNHDRTGDVVEGCTVVRMDPGVGALLAFPTDDNTTIDGDAEAASSFKPISIEESYQDACRVRSVYVHISKSIDGPDKVSEAVFAKDFAPSTKHTVRVVSSANLIEDVASGATAPSIVKAHVLTHSDLSPGKVYKQVPVCSQLPDGSVLIDFGMGIHGLIPEVQLFDQNATSDYRQKMRKVKYSVGAKVDVRVLTVDTSAKKCLLTAKKSLVKAADEEIISSYEDVKVGQRAVGYVSNNTKDYVFITFFNGVYGRVTARSLAAELGIENPQENYTRGDVVHCRVVNKKKRAKRKLRGQRFDDEMEVDEHDDGEDGFFELILSLHLTSKEDETPTESTEQLQSLIHLRSGSVLPLKSLRVVELVNGKEKDEGFVPGYAIVSIKSKYIVSEAEAATMPPFIECKLPYDQLLDNFNDKDIATAAALDELAENMLTVGKKINRKGLILSDPKKTRSDYTSGTGQLAVISIRPRLVSTAEAQSKNDSNKTSDTEIVLPGTDTHLYAGLIVQGYVVQVDARYGAFVRFLNGVTGLVPKVKGGLLLKPYCTVIVEVLSVDDSTSRLRILLGLSKIRDPFAEDSLTDESITPPINVGDTIEEAIIETLSFHRANLKVLDKKLVHVKNVRTRLHCSMTETNPFPKEGKISTISTEQKITPCHPFFGWTIGDALKNLQVASVSRRDNLWIVEVTNRKIGQGSAKNVQSAEELSTGDSVSGIVNGYSKSQGLFIQIAPEVSCFLPGLEISEDINVLNNLQRYFPLGSCLECTVVDKATWKKIRSKFHPDRQHAKDETQWGIPFLSLLIQKNGKGIIKPRRGDLIVARVNRTFPSAYPPDLMLDLRGGFVGRCCITELEEMDEWNNFPLGRGHKAKSQHDSSVDDGRVDSKDDDISQKRDEEEDEPFAHGTFVQCRVLAGVPSKPLVEVSLRCSRIEGDLDEDEPPEKGAIVHAYVVDTRKEGCFLRLSRQVEGRAILKELCDGFIPDPAAAFPPGRLIAGLVKDIRRVDKKDGHKIMVADIDMRESTLIDEAEDRVKFEDVKIGDKCKGTVTRIEEYGVFVRLVNSNVSGLVHKSECSDKYIKSLTDLYAPGDLVKLLVVKIDPLKKLVGFSMKASHFLNDPDSDDSSSSDEEDAMSVEDVDDNEDEKDGVDEENLELKGIVDDLDSEDENFAAKLASKIHETDDIDSDDSVAGSGDEESDSENDSGSDSSSEGEDENPNTGAEIKLDTNVGFNWNALTADDAERSVASDDSDASDTDGKDDEEDGLPGTSHKSRKKQAQRRREEQEITRREMALADGTVDANPETAADFERLIAGDPNSSELWIRYMAFHLTLADVEAAREVANRAFDRIEFREEKEKLNVWCALLTLELQYGNDESLQSTLERACQHNNPKQVYLRYCEMLEKQATSSSSSSSPESIKKTDETYTKMCKKFKDKKKVWIAHLEYLLKNGRHEEAFALSKRALLSLKPYKHVETMSKFAQLVFQYASAEKARTIFEGLLSKHPKRLDLLFVYADHEMKHGDGVDAARSLFVRVTNPRDATLPMKLSDKQMKRVFKKWFALEESHGTEETQERVKDAARAFVEYTAS